MELAGKVCVITGATSGIGAVAADALARNGARLVVVARNERRGATTLERLRALASGAAHRVEYADLSRIAEMRRVAAEIAAAEPRIDLLANNAGALFATRQVTEDGLEKTFALNHVAYTVLTHGLAKSLRAAAPARVVNTASEAHRGARYDAADLQSAKRYKGVRAYNRSKLYNILWTRELARRWAGTGVTVNCFHPGFVASRFGDEAGGLLAHGVRFAKLFAISPEQGARTLVYLASAPEVAQETGGYFVKCRRVRPSDDAESETAARVLWDETARIAGIG